MTQTSNEFNRFYARFDDKCFEAENAKIVIELKVSMMGQLNANLKM